MKQVRVSNFIVPAGYSAITLYPFIFLRSETRLKDAVLINHERIHLAQQRELLIVFFYLLYVADFIVKYCKYRDWKEAYRNIVFEREAYANQSNLDYLKTRKKFAYLR